MPAGDLIFGTAFMKELGNWRRLDQLSSKKIEAIQEERLIQLLRHASTTVPFYQKLHIQPKGDCREWLRSYPVMQKSIIREHLDSMVLDDPTKLICEKSSGSSGIQGEVFMTRKEQFAAIAIQTHLWEWAGYRLGTPILQLGMTPQRQGVKSLKDKVLRTHYQQAFSIDETEAKRALLQFSKINGLFGGYASGLYAYACLAERLDIECHFKSIISWGDKMFDYYRSKIEKVFQAPVFDIYGTTEGFVISGQCQFGNLHIMTPHVMLELLNEKGEEVEPGQLGHVVVTRLDAYAMPLIRYYLGDLAIKANAEELCPCGKPYPMLRKIIGRDTDIVYTHSGKYLIVHFFTGIFEHVPEIRQFRVVQRDLTGIEIEYIPGERFYPEILESIKRRISYYLNEPFSVSFSEVAQIPPTASGKPQIIQSFVDSLSNSVSAL